MLARFKVHAGDFMKSGEHQFLRNQFSMKVPGKILHVRIPASEIAELTVASEEAVKKFGGTIGWGAVGGALLGPVGLLAGLLVGGRAKEVTFICKFKDGRKFLATAPSKLFTAMQASVFE